MTPQQFLTEFGHIASAPNGVQRLREMVLFFAFSGELVFPCPDFELRPLKQLATKIGSGSTPKGGREFYESTGIPLIRSMNIHFKGFEASGLVFLNDEQAKGLSSATVQPNDVLLNITGASIGRVTTAPEEMAGARVNQHVTIIRPIDSLDSKYLAQYLASPVVQRLIEDIQTGATREALTKGMIERFEIPLPPLAEQKRIVAKVDELMALCDKLEALQNQRKAARAVLTKEILGRVASDATVDAQTCLQNLSLLVSDVDQIPVLRQTILSLAVQGKLVPQDPGDESVSKTFRRLMTLAAKLTKAQLPNSWISVELGKLGEWRGGGTPSKARTEFWDGDIPWVSPKDMKTIEISDAIDHISVQAIERSSVRWIPARSLLMVVRGMILSHSFPVAITSRDVTINQDMKALIPEDPRLADYLLMVLRAFKPHVVSVIEHSTHGTCKLETDTLHSLCIPIPPLAEQKRIVAKVDELMALCDTLEAKLRKASQVQEQLALSSIAALTGIQSQEKETMKAPKTELVARLKIGKKPTTKDQAPLAALLVRHNGELDPKVLWQHSSLEIDAFYHQLKFEMTAGWIVQPEVPSMRVVRER